MSLKINKKTKLQVILCLILSIACVVASIPAFNAFAEDTLESDKTLDQLRDEYNQIEQEIQQNQEALEEVEDDIRTNEEKLEDINGEISNIEEQLANLDERLAALEGDMDYLNESIALIDQEIILINQQIADTEEQIAQTQVQMAETKERLLARVRENYMAGDGSNIEMLLEAEDIASFLTRKEIIQRLEDNDIKLKEDLGAEISSLEALEADLQARKAELEEKEATLVEQKATLLERQADYEESQEAQKDKKQEATAKYEEIEDILLELDEDSEAYQKEIERQKAEREKVEAQIDEYIREHGSSQGDIPDEEYNNDGDMLWPVPGSTRVTAGYPTYPSGGQHWGIDIVRTDVTTKGSPFRAAQGGEVIIAYNDDNWNYGFGNYCVIDHGDGTQTLYAHADSLKVSKGDVVQKGETIGYIGETGNVTGPHLHFEVRVKSSDGNVSRVQPLNYVSQP